MILLLDVVSPIPEFHIINENKIIYSVKIIQNNDERISDNIIPIYLQIENAYKLNINIKKLIITIGPGSYTALRIGASFIAGISQSIEVPVAVVSAENLYDFLYRKNNYNIGIYFESSNNQIFFTYCKDFIHYHDKVENNEYKLPINISHIFYNKKIPNFINKNTINSVFFIKKIILENLNNIDFKEQMIIKPIYISNKTLLN